MSENRTHEVSPKRLVAEVVSIGDEIVSGSVIDTNSAYLSRQLSGLGVSTLFHATVGDSLSAIVKVLEIAARRADLVLVTGGLGPTEDDLTRQAAAAAAKVELRQDRESLESIRRLFAVRERPMPESNFIQSYFPAGSQIIPNQNGTAPGFALTFDRAALWGDTGSAYLLAFPGVPAELEEMWTETGRSFIEQFIVHRLGFRRHIQFRSIHCFGAGESDIESRLPHLIARNRVPQVGITASGGVITLRITAEGADVNECQRQLDETAEIIYERIGEFIYGEGNQTLASVVADSLLKEKESLGVIEWGTRGFLSKRIDERVFAGALIETPDRPVYKTLNLPSDSKPETILRTFAEKMGISAVVAVGRFPTEEELYAIKGANAFVYALDGDRFEAESFVYGLHPAIIDSLFANRALNLLRRMRRG